MTIKYKENEVGDEGTINLSEALMTNSTLTSLNLDGFYRMFDKKEKKKKIKQKQEILLEQKA